MGVVEEDVQRVSVRGACWDRRRHSSGGGGLAAVSETDAGTAESGGSV